MRLRWSILRPSCKPLFDECPNLSLQASRVILTASFDSATSNSLQANCVPLAARGISSPCAQRVSITCPASNASRLRTRNSRTGIETSSSTGKKASLGLSARMPLWSICCDDRSSASSFTRLAVSDSLTDADLSRDSRDGPGNEGVVAMHSGTCRTRTRRDEARLEWLNNGYCSSLNLLNLVNGNSHRWYTDRSCGSTAPLCRNFAMFRIEVEDNARN